MTITYESNVDEINGIGPKRVSILNGKGIYKVSEFLLATDNDDKVVLLSKELGLSPSKLREIITRLDLARENTKQVIHADPARKYTFHFDGWGLGLLLLSALFLIIGVFSGTTFYNKSDHLYMHALIFFDHNLESDPYKSHTYMWSEMRKSGKTITYYRFQKETSPPYSLETMEYLDGYDGLPVLIAIKGSHANTQIRDVKVYLQNTTFLYEPVNGKMYSINKVDIPFRVENEARFENPSFPYLYTLIWIGTPPEISETGFVDFVVEATFEEPGFENPMDVIRPGTLTTTFLINSPEYVLEDIVHPDDVNLEFPIQQYPRLIYSRREYTKTEFEYIWSSKMSGMIISPQEWQGENSLVFNLSESNEIIDGKVVYQSNGQQWISFLVGIFAFEAIALAFRRIVKTNK
jgi:hypothetical protein